MDIICSMTGGFALGCGVVMLLIDIQNEMKTKEPFFMLALGIGAMLIGFL